MQQLVPLSPTIPKVREMGGKIVKMFLICLATREMVILISKEQHTLVKLVFFSRVFVFFKYTQ